MKKLWLSKLIEAESRVAAAGGEKWGDVNQRVQLLVIRRTSSGQSDVEHDDYSLSLLFTSNLLRP